MGHATITIQYQSQLAAGRFRDCCSPLAIDHKSPRLGFVQVEGFLMRGLCKPVAAQQIDGQQQHAWRCPTYGQGSTCARSDRGIGYDCVTKSVPGGMTSLAGVTPGRGRYAHAFYIARVQTTPSLEARCEASGCHKAARQTRAVSGLEAGRPSKWTPMYEI